MLLTHLSVSLYCVNLLVLTTEQGCRSASKATGELVNFACMWLWNLPACLQSVVKPACTTFSKCLQGCSLTLLMWTNSSASFNFVGGCESFTCCQKCRAELHLFSDLLVSKYSCACLLQNSLPLVQSTHPVTGQSLLRSRVASRAITTEDQGRITHV